MRIRPKKTKPSSRTSTNWRDTFFSVVFLPLLSLCLISCSSKDTKLANYLERANDLFENDDFATAEIEYLNVLQIENESAEAISRLGIIYYDQVRFARAFPYLTTAAEIDPKNSEVLYRLGFLYLVSGDSKSAARKAEDILAYEPSNRHAPILLANTAKNIEEMENRIQQLKFLKASKSENPSIEVGIAILEGRTRKLELAKASIQRALAIDPNSHYAHVVQRGLHLTEGNTSAAVAALKKAAENSPLRSANRVDLAQHYLESGNIESYKQTIEPIIKKAPKFLPALILSAKYEASQNQLDKALRWIDSVLALDPTNHDAIALSGNLHIAKKKISEALKVFEKGVERYPESAAAQFNLARAKLLGNDIDDARKGLAIALKLDPEHKEALALMSRIQLQSGDYKSAEEIVQKLLILSPNDLSLGLQMAAIKTRQKQLDAAIRIYIQLEEDHAENAQLPILRAKLHAQQGNSLETTRAIEKSLGRDPDYFLALDLLTTVLISEERYKDALEQVAQRINRNPTVAGFYLIKARIFVAQEEFDYAEDMLLKAIDLDPDNRTPYMILSQVYVRDDKRTAALERLQQVIAKDPEDVSALMIICGIYEYEMKFENARDTYEKILKVNPDFPPALNNLAYLYSEKFDRHDDAYTYANRARQLLPHDPSIADTLGWILFKRGDVEWARGLIQESSAKLPTNPEVRYHLGMTYYMLGDEDASKEHFEMALAHSSDFNGKDDLKNRISILEIGSSAEKMLSVPELESMLQSQSNDPVLLMRLATALEIAGEAKNALSTYEKVLSINPDHVPAILQSANLHHLNGDVNTALELGKKAYKLEPNNPYISSRLGKFAYSNGEYDWSASLLQSSARNIIGDPNLQFDLALSLISVGKIQEAKEQLSLTPKMDNGDRANQLLDFLNAIENSDAVEIRILADKLDEKLVKSWALAAIAVTNGNDKEATDRYQKILDEFSSFQIAKRELTYIYSRNGIFSEKAIRIAVDATRSFPNDNTLKRALESIQKLKEDSSTAGKEAG